MARTSYWWAAYLSASMTVIALALAGCGGGQGSAAKNTAKAKLSPREIVDKTITAYKSALAYSDVGRVRLSYQQDGQTLEDSAPLAVQYALPNRLHIKAYQTEVASDGNQLHAVVRDDVTANLDGQVVRRPAPDKLTLDDLYSDEVLRDTLSSGLGRHPVQLELLFGDAPLLELVKPDAKMTLLDSQDVEGHRCYRIEAQLADGPYVFWIDEQEYLLRRIEYPAAALLPDLAKNPEVTNLAVVADFRDAKFAKNLPTDTFKFSMAGEAKIVRYFVLPPQGLPSSLFGQSPGSFKLTTAAGEPLASEEFSGKPTLLVWFSNDPNCAWGLKQVSEALATSSVKDKVAAYVVATEDASVTSEQVAALLKQWEVDLPLLRDFDFAGRDLFGVKNAPTLVVLDAAGKVQIFEDGINSRLPQTLPVVLERLVAGDDLAAEILADARKSQEQYAQNLATASGDATQTAVVEITASEPVAASEPEHFTRTPLWTIADKALTAPGNFLVVPDAEKPRIYVVDGHRTVVELDAKGQIVKKHELKIPEDAGVSYLRTAVDKDGKRWFVGSALLGRRLFVFDEQWQTKLSYPPDDQPHEGLHAVEIADLAADGTPELYVGFWSLIGVQGVTLEGKREWTNRVIPTVLSIVATPPNDLGWRKILASGDRGFLFRMNQYGHHDPKLEIPNRQVHRLVAADWEPPLATTYCGVSYLAEGRLLAIGLNAELQEVWSYQLPAGQFNNQIEYIQSGRLRADDQGEWVLAAPDGSVHIISDDGDFSDTFALGELLTGLATAKFGDDRVVLTSTKSGVTAWKLEKK